ncbi:MAG TPA: hypothetical protein PKI94_04010 [Candidatus Gastranaerophilaceae bacterium]|nr:hypothetical protein [Candidatus Gastranaerophilaceae bacterium]
MKIIPITTFQMFNSTNLPCKKPSFKGVISDVDWANQESKKEQDAFYRTEVYAEHRNEMEGPFICHDGTSYNSKLDAEIQNVRKRLNKLNISEDDFEQLFKTFMEERKINEEIEPNPVKYYRTNGLKPIVAFLEFLEKIKEMTAKN